MLSINNTTDFTTSHPQMKWGTSSLFIKQRIFQMSLFCFWGFCLEIPLGCSSHSFHAPYLSERIGASKVWFYHFLPFSSFTEESDSRLKVQKLRDQSESSSVFLRGLYTLGTECVRSDGYGASTELVRSGYGAARSIFLGPPTPPQNTF